MRTTYNKIIRLFLLTLFLTFNVYGADHYIRSGATGANDGSSWANAYTSFPSSTSYIRGDDYYVADGSYAGATFATAPSGSQYIRIFKATAANHGADNVGWDNAYDTTNAYFSAPVSFNSSYWEFNGQRGYYNTNYGFEVTWVAGRTTVDAGGHVIGSENGSSHLRISGVNAYMFPYGTAHDSLGVDDTEHPTAYTHAFNFQNGNSDIIVSNCWGHDVFGAPFRVVGCSDVTYEHMYLTRNRNTAAQHSAGAVYNGGNSNIVARWNWYRDTEGSASCIDCVSSAGASVITNYNLAFYGNVVLPRTSGWSSVNNTIAFAFNSDSSNPLRYRGIKIYNNTIYNDASQAGQGFSFYMGDQTASGIEIINNLIINTTAINLTPASSAQMIICNWLLSTNVGFISEYNFVANFNVNSGAGLSNAHPTGQGDNQVTHDPSWSWWYLTNATLPTFAGADDAHLTTTISGQVALHLPSPYDKDMEGYSYGWGIPGAYARLSNGTIPSTPAGDYVAPVISVSSPTSGGSAIWITNQYPAGPIAISGTYSDADSSVTNVTSLVTGMGSITFGGGTWSTTYTPITFVNTLVFKAVDTYGNAGQSVLYVYTSDTNPPTVSFTSPTTSTSWNTNTSPINVSGSTSDDPGSGISNLTLYLSTVSGPVTNSGTVNNWTVTNIIINPGPVVLTAVATDQGGNVKSNNMTITYGAGGDVTPPTIAFTDPNGGNNWSTNNPNIRVSASASDDTGVDHVTGSSDISGSLTVNGTTSPYSDITLSLGANVITFTAFDAANNQTSDTITITLVDNTLPTVSISNPNGGNNWSTNVADVRVYASCADNLAIDHVSASSSTEGALTVNGTGSAYADTHLSFGANTITFTVYDTAGNSASDSIVITLLDTTSPSTTIISPNGGNNWTTNKIAVRVSISASDNDSIDHVTASSSVSGALSVNGTTSAYADVNLSLGANTITFTSYDPSGNSSSDSIIITLSDNTNPQISITDPNGGSNWTTNKVDIRISATSSDDIGLDHVSASSDTDGTLSVNGTASAYADTSLSLGDNIITFTVYDSSANSANDSITVTLVDNTSPQVTITSPNSGNDFTTSSTSVTLSGSSSDDISGVNLVEININSSGWTSATGTNPWSANINLNDGANSIQARSRDVSGNYSSIDSITITYSTNTGTIYYLPFRIN